MVNLDCILILMGYSNFNGIGGLAVKSDKRERKVSGVRIERVRYFGKVVLD